MRFLAVPLLVLALVAPAVLAAAPAPRPSAPERLVVDLARVGPDALAEALAAPGATLVRVDEALGFAIVLARDASAFADAVGGAARPDARGGAALETPVADAPNDFWFPAQWGPIALNAPQAWAVEDGSADVVVAVVDTGLWFPHVDFAGVPVINGRDFIDGDDDPTDLHGHGTHVAGTVAAARDNAVGIAGMARVTLLPVRVLDEDGYGWCTDFASGIMDALAKGAFVINLSLYCNVDEPTLRTAVDHATAAGALVVVAAGNFQTSNPDACVTFPARYASAVAVAAQDPTLTPATYSCQGAALDLAAPGSQIQSTVLHNAYARFSGTSMAAPHVAGAAALVKSRYPAMSAADVRATLEASARDLGPPGHDTLYGHGMVDPVRALTGMPVFVPAP